MANHNRDPQTHLSAAAEVIASERHKCQAEQTALRRFRSRIRDLADDTNTHTDVDATSYGTGQATGRLMTRTNPGTHHTNTVQREIRTAYKQTVMSTAAATELNETPVEHMAAEFSPDISTAVYVSSDPPPNLLTAIGQSTTNMITARGELMQKLDDEAAVVKPMSSEVARIIEEVDSCESVCHESSFHELINHHCRLGELRDECAKVADRRQSDFHSTYDGQYTRFEWAEYLYDECRANHPVLAAVTELIEWIDELRKTLSQEITTI